MKSLISFSIAAASIGFIAAATLSGCNNRANNLGSNTQKPSNSTTNTTPTPASDREVAAQNTDCASGNPIKGFNSKRLGKIAILPQSPVYSKIKPLRCFPDTEAAQKAGYTVPK